MASSSSTSTEAPVHHEPSPTPERNVADARMGGERLPRAVVPQAVPSDAPLDHPSLFFNRELSWLDYNWRVLRVAQNPRTPLLERVRFLGVAASNLDGFVRKRIGGLKRQAAADVTTLSPDGRTPEEQLNLLSKAIGPLYRALGTTWKNLLEPQLDETIGLRVRQYESLSAEQQGQLEAYFRKNIFPILTPLAVDPGRPFPFISNMSLSLAVLLRHPERGSEHFARVKVPTSRKRWLPLQDPLQFVPIEQVIAHHADDLFRGMEVKGVYAFRVTRNADVRRDEEEADDLLEMISERLRERRFAPVVRLEVETAMPASVRTFLKDKLEIGDRDLYVAEGPIDYSDVTTLADLHIPDEKYQKELRFSSWTPVVPPRLRQDRGEAGGESIFDVIREDDLLVHHPYESFTASVQRFIEEAARDPHVLAIKQALYRTSAESPIVAALVDAAERGKQVAVLVEVKARFDEEENIEWGRKLEDAGVHVAYGLVGLKTHAQATLVVRREADTLCTYCHISTGNYNTQTARRYTDYGLLTCDRRIGHDLTNLFHYLTGYAPEQKYNQLLVAPQGMRAGFLRLIENEIEHEREGRDGRIVAKMNELGDRQLIRALYEASRAGVDVDLVVRGICRLRPGIEGISESIRVLSIVGRFLEHDRVFSFRNGGDHRLYISSGDWQRSRLDDRVEAAVPVQDPTLQKRLQRALMYAMEDATAWELRPNGRYVQRTQDAEGTPRLQDALMQEARDR